MAGEMPVKPPTCALAFAEFFKACQPRRQRWGGTFVCSVQPPVSAVGWGGVIVSRQRWFRRAAGLQAPRSALRWRLAHPVTDSGAAAAMQDAVSPVGSNLDSGVWPKDTSKAGEPRLEPPILPPSSRGPLDHLSLIHNRRGENCAVRFPKQNMRLYKRPTFHLVPWATRDPH